MDDNGARVAATDLVVDLLAAYRLTRLVSADKITEPIRDRIIHATYVAAGREGLFREGVAASDVPWSEVAMADQDAPKLATLITCRWCCGWWLSVLIVLASRIAPRWWRPVGRALALSAAAALIARAETD